MKNTSLLLCLLLPFLTACFPEKPFQPNPPAFKGWVKSGVSDVEVKLEMQSCGFNNVYARERNIEYSEEIKHENCMFQKGYHYISGYKGTCYSNGWERYPVCVEHRKTH